MTVLGFAGVGLLALLTRGESEAAKRSSPAGLALHQNGYFNRPHGLFFVHGERLEVYNLVTRTADPKEQKEVLWGIDNKELTNWKGEPYFHESYELVEGVWEERERERERILTEAGALPGFRHV